MGFEAKPQYMSLSPHSFAAPLNSVDPMLLNLLLRLIQTYEVHFHTEGLSCFPEITGSVQVRIYRSNFSSSPSRRPISHPTCTINYRRLGCLTEGKFPALHASSCEILLSSRQVSTNNSPNARWCSSDLLQETLGFHPPCATG